MGRILSKKSTGVEMKNKRLSSDKFLNLKLIEEIQKEFWKRNSKMKKKNQRKKFLKQNLLTQKIQKKIKIRKNYLLSRRLLSLYI